MNSQSAPVMMESPAQTIQTTRTPTWHHDAAPAQLPWMTSEDLCKDLCRTYTPCDAADDQNAIAISVAPIIPVITSGIWAKVLIYMITDSARIA